MQKFYVFLMFWLIVVAAYSTLHITVRWVLSTQSCYTQSFHLKPDLLYIFYRQRDGVTMFSGQTTVEYGIMPFFVVAAPFRGSGLDIFCIFSCLWSSIALSLCRCCEAKKLSRFISFYLYQTLHLGPPLRQSWAGPSHLGRYNQTYSSYSIIYLVNNETNLTVTARRFCCCITKLKHSQNVLLFQS